MSETSTGDVGAAFIEQCNSLDARQAIDRAFGYLAEAAAHAEARDYEAARGAIEVAAIQYADVRWYTEHNRHAELPEERELQECGFRLAALVGSESARNLFQPDQVVPIDPEDPVAEDDSEPDRGTAPIAA